MRVLFARDKDFPNLLKIEFWIQHLFQWSTKLPLTRVGPDEAGTAGLSRYEGLPDFDGQSLFWSYFKSFVGFIGRAWFIHYVFDMFISYEQFVRIGLEGLYALEVIAAEINWTE